MATKQAIPKAIFLLVVIASSVFLVISTQNYLEFYSAVEKLSLRVIDVSTLIELENVNITLVFAIFNPTGYVGLSLREFVFTLFFENNSDNTALYGGFVSYGSAPEPIEPYGNKTIKHETILNLNKDVTKLFKNLYQNNQGDIAWMLKGNAHINSFVGTLDVAMSDKFPNHMEI